jgi:putative ATP-binding cassette transporter
VKLLRFFFRQSAGLTAGAILIGAVSGAAGAVLIAQINQLLDRQAPAAAWASAPAFAAVVLALLVSSYLSRTLMSYLSERTARDLRIELCGRIVATPLRRLETAGGGDLLAALTQDVTSLTNALILFPTICINVFLIIGCLVYLSLLSLAGFGAVAAFLLLAVLSVKLPERFAVRKMAAARRHLDDLFDSFRSLISGIKELKMHRARQQAFLEGPVAEAADAYQRTSFSSLHRYAATNSWSQGLYFIFIGAVLFGLVPGFDTDPSLLVGFTLVSLYMRAPMVQMLNALPTMARARVALRRIESLDLAETARAGTDPASVGDSVVVELRGVTHKYYREREDREFTLGPIDLRLESGELVFLAGGNGSGKTTLAKVLAGLYPPETGSISVDGRPVGEADRAAYREHFAFVFTDFHLFESLLGLGRGGTNLDQRARIYLELLELDHKVEIVAGGLSTTELSQGQRKRLALLTAYLEDRPVYIFDEWAADQDPTFKDIFYRRLLPDLKARGKAVLAISHDERFFDVADRVIRLENGRVLADGDSLRRGAAEVASHA